MQVGTRVESYGYDGLNQLTNAAVNGNAYVYTYDSGGNILTETKNGVRTKTYTYGASDWRDLLTAYNGNVRN